LLAQCCFKPSKCSPIPIAAAAAGSLVTWIRFDGEEVVLPFCCGWSGERREEEDATQSGDKWARMDRAGMVLLYGLSPTRKCTGLGDCCLLCADFNFSFVFLKPFLINIIFLTKINLIERNYFFSHTIT
jgi:hypothetical protein